MKHLTFYFHGTHPLPFYQLYTLGFSLRVMTQLKYISFESDFVSEKSLSDLVFFFFIMKRTPFRSIALGYVQ